MKPLLVNTFDQTGGAARAAYRLLCGLHREAVPAQMLVRGKTGHDADVIKCEPDWLGWCKGLLDIFPTKRYPNRKRGNFNPGLVPDRLKSSIIGLTPDLIHLHWVSYGFLRIETLGKLGSPVVWTLHDSWAFTGGCFLPGECTRYQDACGCCPVLGSQKENDLSRRVWERKKKIFTSVPLAVVAPSRWMAERARSSSLLAHSPIDIIPNGLDTKLYSPGDRDAARRRFGLPMDRHLILYGARHALSDPNKGIDLLVQALHHFCQKEGNAELVIFGDNPDDKMFDFPLPVRNVGEVWEEASLVDLYRAADIFVLPSRQENLPNVILEAMACGTPCVAFQIGGLPDLIKHKKTGFLTLPYETEEFGQGISWLLSSKKLRQEVARRARNSICAGFSLESVASKYVNLYQRLLSTTKKNVIENSSH